jgi:hypothetical protein
MTIAISEVQLTWATATTTAVVTNGSNVTSDTATISGTAIELSAQLKADHAGTPASGHTVDWFALYTLGDPDGASSDEFGTTGHAVFLARLDLNTEDPAIAVTRLNPNVKALKLYAVNNGSTATGVTVSATLQEKTA